MPQVAGQFIAQFSMTKKMCSIAPTNYEAESGGWLRWKVFGRRVETIFSSPTPQSRVFSKNLQGNCATLGRRCKTVSENGLWPLYDVRNQLLNK
jgi:hypothetical protein